MTTSRRHSPTITTTVALALTALAPGCCDLFPALCQPPETTLQTEIILTRSGGLVATNDQVSVTPDGMLTATGRLVGDQMRQLSADEMSGLLDRLAGWDQLTVGARNPNCADVLEYSITYAGRTLAWDDCTIAVPQRLKDLADYLLALSQSDGSTP